MKRRPKQVTPNIPNSTAVPSDCRISAPAPVATASGVTPRMKAREVIRIGRRRVRAACTAAFFLLLAGKFHDQDGVLGSQSDEHDEADLGQDVDGHAA